MKQVAGKKIATSVGRGGDTVHACNHVADGAGSYLVHPVTELVEVSIADVVDSGIDSSGPVDDFVYLDIGSVDRERKTFVEPKLISLTKAPSRARQKVQTGDVLVSMTRPNLNAVALVTQEFHGSIASTGFHVLRSPWIKTGFLYYLVQTEKFIDAMCSVVQGALYPAVRPRDIEAFKFYLPPRTEQTRIVEKLEELLSELDAGVAELKAAQRKLAQYRQSLLKAAVEGALTADWRASRTSSNELHETGADLLQRILAERRARWEAKQLAKFAEQGKTPPRGWQAKYPEPVAPDTTDLSTLPDGWIWASLGQLIESLASGSRDWAPYYGRGTCTFVMAQNVRPWRPDFSFRQLVDPPEGNRDRARSLVEADDLLLTIVGANTGQACRVAEQLKDHFVCQSVALIRLTDSSLSEFINAVLNSPEHGQKQFREMNYGAGRPHLSFEQVESVLVPLPPTAEQQEILRQLDLALMATNDAEAQLLDANRYAAAQRKNILKAAFSGQLVPQDSTDEPASVLLERIRAERIASDASRKPGSRRKGAKP